MTEITDRDPEEMDHADLRAEYSETGERLFFGPRAEVEERDRIHDRRMDLWEEMRRRTDVDQPECPECGDRRWGQTPGNPKTCVNCDYRPGLEEEKLVEEIDVSWQMILAGTEASEA